MIGGSVKKSVLTVLCALVVNMLFAAADLALANSAFALTIPKPNNP